MQRATEAVIPAAGLGLRMRPVTLDWPKPALPFLNRPTLHWILDGLRAAGVRRTLINLHHLPDRVRAAAESHGGGLDFHFSHEPEILGTAGLFGPLAGHIRGDRFLVANGDVVGGLPTGPLFEELEAHPEALVVLALREGSPAYTGVQLSPDGRIGTFRNGTHMYAGLYAARRELLQHLPPPGPAELVPDLLEPLLASGAVRGVCLSGAWWDLGDVRTYLEASVEALQSLADGRLTAPEGSRLECRNGFPVLLHRRSQIAGGVAFTGFAVVGEDATVGAGAVLGEAVLLPGTTLAPGQRLVRAILSPSGTAHPSPPDPRPRFA
jgi:NDP-sugar pyrophosphorylase family protein